MATKVSNPYNFNIKDDYNSSAKLIWNPAEYQYWYKMVSTGDIPMFHFGFDISGENIYPTLVVDNPIRKYGIYPDIKNYKAVAYKYGTNGGLYLENYQAPWEWISVTTHRKYKRRDDLPWNYFTYGPYLFKKTEVESGKYYYKSRKIDENIGMSNIDDYEDNALGDYYYPIDIYCFDGVDGPIPDKNGYVDLSEYAENYIDGHFSTKELSEENLRYLNSGIIPTNMNSVFYNCMYIEYIPISYIDTSNVTNMSRVFSNCTQLIDLDISYFNTSNVINMDWMFAHCRKITNLDLSNFNTSKVTNMEYMFYNCENLTTLNISSFDTSNVTNINSMFNRCKNLTSVIGSLDLSNCTSAWSVFNNCNTNANIHLKNVPRSLDLSRIGGTEGQQYIIDNYID